MDIEEAKNILIGNAVCMSPKLHCDEHCPFYEEEGDCEYIGKEFELEEAVKIIITNKAENVGK